MRPHRSLSGKATKCFLAIRLTILAVAACWFLAPLSTASGAIVPLGNVSPTNPAGWTSSTDAYIGDTSDGSLTLDAGSSLRSSDAYLGNSVGATGLVDATGFGTIWNASDLFVGHRGVGTLNITSGAAVNSFTADIGYEAGSTGLVTVNGAGSKWTNLGELLVPSPIDPGVITSQPGTIGGSVTLPIGAIPLGATGLGTSIVPADVIVLAMPHLTVGASGNGTLLVGNGGNVTSDYGSIAQKAGSTGTVTVDGSGSKWSNRSLTVGVAGTATLNIRNGGEVSVTNITDVATQAGSSGTINFDNGTLTTGTLYASPTQLTGSGTVNATGLVSDIDLLFDAAHPSLTRAILLNSQPGQNITVNLNLTTTTLGSLGAGIKETGSLTIRDGIVVNSNGGYLGYGVGSIGTATVSGTGSKWNSQSVLYVGKSGSGALSITNGASVASTSGYLGELAGASGSVDVSGAGSNWTLSSGLYVGQQGQGALTIRNGGSVTNKDAAIGYKVGSTGSVTVEGAGSTWTNNGSLAIGCFSVFGSSTGTLNIRNGGLVVASYGTSLGSSASNTINFENGTLTTKSLAAAPSQLRGTGVINTAGLVSDVDLRFDSSHGLNQTLQFNADPGQDITVNLDMSGTNTGSLGAGFTGHGSLTITDGLQVTSSGGAVGLYSGSVGVASVSGSGSKWTTGSLSLGSSGSGTLNVTGGGQVTAGYVHLGGCAGSVGSATVDGPGSSWVAEDTYIGREGTGNLSVLNGGSVSGRFGYIGGINGTSSATVDGPGSTLTLSADLFVGCDNFYVVNIDGTIINNGHGILDIRNGGAVSVARTTDAASPRGETRFNNGTLNTRTLVVVPSRMTGTGVVNTRGLVGDFDLVFDATHGLTQTLPLNSLPGQDITVNLDLSGTENGNLGLGYEGAGSLIIQDGRVVNSNNGYLGGYPGAGPGSTALGTVSGAGSQWNNASTLYVGGSGSSKLLVTAGGRLSSNEGRIGGDLAPSSVTVSGPASTWTNSSTLYIRHGSLLVSNGGSVTSSSGQVGCSDGVGSATVAGPSSRWTNSGNLYVAEYGDGRMLITDGGVVTDAVGYIGYTSGAVGQVTVQGASSQWTNTSKLYIGDSGTGLLKIADGGVVSATSASINAASLLALDVGDGSSLNLGTGKITNNGKVRMVADHGTAAGNYTPIIAATWDGSGSYEALGGMWNGDTHVFTVSGIEQAASRNTASIDLSTKQRIEIADSEPGGTGWSVGASFLAQTSPTTIDFAATALDNALQTSLDSHLQTGQTILGGWLFSASGYTAGDPVYLSFDIGTGRSRDDLQVWHYDGSNWTSFDAGDLTYGGSYASFTVTGFSGYAIVTVPEPSTIVLLLAGAVCLAWHCFRRRNR